MEILFISQIICWVTSVIQIHVLTYKNTKFSSLTVSLPWGKHQHFFPAHSASSKLCGHHRITMWWAGHQRKEFELNWVNVKSIFASSALSWQCVSVCLTTGCPGRMVLPCLVLYVTGLGSCTVTGSASLALEGSEGYLCCRLRFLVVKNVMFRSGSKSAAVGSECHWPLVMSSKPLVTLARHSEYTAQTGHERKTHRIRHRILFLGALKWLLTAATFNEYYVLCLKIISL